MQGELGMDNIPEQFQSGRVSLLDETVIVSLVQMVDSGLLGADHGLRVAGQPHSYFKVTWGRQGTIDVKHR